MSPTLETERRQDAAIASTASSTTSYKNQFMQSERKLKRKSINAKNLKTSYIAHKSSGRNEKTDKPVNIESSKSSAAFPHFNWFKRKSKTLPHHRKLVSSASFSFSSNSDSSGSSSSLSESLD
jgi:hypothetical protein